MCLLSFSFEDWNFNLDTKLTIQTGDETSSSLLAAVNIQQSGTVESRVWQNMVVRST
jgi:hypothetical protein